MTKFSLNQQIEEVDRELKFRADVYPRLVTRGKMRQSIADYQVERMRAVRATLVWLQENEDYIRGKVAELDRRPASENES